MAADYRYLMLLALLESKDVGNLSRVKDSFFSGSESSQEARKFFLFIKNFSARHNRFPKKSECVSHGHNVVKVSQSFGHYLSEVAMTSNRNMLIEAISRMSESLGNNNIDAALQIFRDAQYRMTEGYGDFFESISSTSDKLRRYEAEGFGFNTREGGIHFGWKTLDDSIPEGMFPGDVTSLISRPNVGKSMIMIILAKNAWLAGKKILFCSMEMNFMSLHARFVASMAGFNPRMILTNTMSFAGRRKFHEVLEDINKRTDKFIYSGEGMDCSTDGLENLVVQHTPDLVLVDSAYLMSPSKRDSLRSYSAWEKVAAVATDLKKISLRQEVPIVASFQYSRNAINRSKKDNKEDDTGLGNIAGSDVIGQISSFVIGMRHLSVPNPLIRHLSLEKNRVGGLCELDINFNYENMDFSERESVENAMLDFDASME